MEKKISVSFLSSKDEKKDLIKLNRTSADYIHVDVMDGHFVRKRNKPFKRLNKMSNVLSKRLDVHLMEKKPAKNINRFALLNTEYITVHVEIDKVDEYLDQIKDYGIKCGLAINPDTDISMLDPYLEKIDMILIMSVYPGKGGQEFIEDTIKKILKIKKTLVSKKLKVKLSVDGGIDDKIAKRLDFVDIIVSGSYIIESDDFEKAINTIRESTNKKKEKSKEKKD